MKLVFASNYLNVHQLPLCEAFMSLLGSDNFRFVASTPFDEARVQSGFEDMNQKPFVIRSYEDGREAYDAISEADVMIGMAYSRPDFIKYRMKNTNKLTFAYCERLLRRGLWFRHVPMKKARVHRQFTRYRNRDNFQVLCSSAFTSYDLSLFGFPSARCWKWGYITEVPSLLGNRDEGRGPMRMVWVARLIELKRPYYPLRLAERLKKDGCDFHITMVGGGPMQGELAGYIADKGLGGCVTLTGALPNREVHRVMSESDVLLFTSNRLEGWGAVVNEGMSNGCTPVVPSLVGSVPYLVEDGVNGRVFRDGDEESFERCVIDLLGDRDATCLMGARARDTMARLWNPDNAAKSFVELASGMLAGSIPRIDEGPCSPAGIIREDWFGGGDV